MTNFIFIISGIGVIQSIIFGVLIILKKNKQGSGWILFSWFMVFAIHLLLILAIYNNCAYLISLVLAKMIGLLHGPMLLLYTFAVFNKHFEKKWFIHLLPFFILSLISFLLSNPALANNWEVVLVLSKTASLTAYPIIVLLWLRTRLEFLKTTRADNFLFDSTWVKTLSILILIFAGLGIIHILANVLLGIEFSIILDILFYVAMVTIIGFSGLRFGIVFDPGLPPAPQQPKARYKNSPLKRNEIVMLRKKIDAFFAESTSYLDADFSLAHLSSKLEIKKHHLSEIINLDMGTTFYDIVNAKRVQHAMQLIQDQRDLNITLEALGYECGFNTKSAFYHHFKNFTGKTPGQFKAEIRPD